MAYDLNGTTQNLSVGSAPTTAAPLTISAWIRPDVITPQCIVSLQSSSSTNWFALFIANSSRVVASTAVSGAATDTNSTAAVTAGTWQHGCGVWDSITSRNVYLIGGNSATNTSNLTPLNINSIRIGARVFGGSPGVFFNGLLAEVGIWNAGLTAAEVASLAKGMTCDKIRPQNLVFYAPLIRDLLDQKGGLAITNNNGATVANHPRVYA